MRCFNFLKAIPGLLLSLVLATGLTTTAYAVDGVSPNLPNLFQLDGDPNDASAALPDDWETLFGDCGYGPLPPASASGCGHSEVFSGILPDFYDPANDPTTFTGGGSKDPEDISGNVSGMKYWLYKDGTVQDKNEITNGMAAAYLIPQFCVDDPGGASEEVVSCDLTTDSDPGDYCWDATGEMPILCSAADLDHEEPSVGDPKGDLGGVGEDYGLGALCIDPGTGHQTFCRDISGSAWNDVIHDDGDLIIYFGADRWSNDGDAYMGFWFLQDELGLSGVPKQGGFEFEGKHETNDVVVLARFPQSANTFPIIEVLKWNPGNPSGSNLESLYRKGETDDGALCDGEGGKLACAITNAQDGPNPNPPTVWFYEPKPNVSEGAGVYPYETFVSGGINVTRLLAGADVCFSTFLVETRASKTFSETATLSDFVLGDFKLCSTSSETKIYHDVDNDLSASGPAPDADDVLVPHTTVPVGDVVVGDWVYDIVEVTGNALGGDLTTDPTGKVLFTLYQSSDCSGTVLNDTTEQLPDADGILQDVDGDVVTILDDGVGDGFARAWSASVQIASTGAHSWRAEYWGEGDFPGSVAACEPFNAIQPKLKITKDVNSCLANDTLDIGRFNLQYAASGGTLSIAPNGSNKGDGGTTDFFGVNPGDYFVGESAGTGTPLAEYVKVFDAGGDCAGGTVNLAGSEQKECGIENIRKPHIIIQKRVVGTPPDSGLFNLQLGLSGGAAPVTLESGSTPAFASYITGDGSDVTTGHTPVRVRINGTGASGAGVPSGDPAIFGDFVVQEQAGFGTTITNYQTVISCDSAPVTQAVFLSGSAADRKVTLTNVEAGEVITCTITNIVVAAENKCPVTNPFPSP